MQTHGVNEILIVGAAEVERVLSMRSCIEAVDQVMRRVSRGHTQLPLRNFIHLPGDGNLFAAMPGGIDEPIGFGAKLISIYPRNAERGLASHNGVVVLMDPESGRVAAILDAASITGIRTAAASAVATRALARPDSSTLAILGAGEQAGTHLEAMAEVLRLRRVRLWARSPGKASVFAEHEATKHNMHIEVSATVQQAVDNADVICAVTAANEPILRGEWLAPGCHVNLVGACLASTREADDEVVRRARFFVDYCPSALAQAGELLHAQKAGIVSEDHLLGEIGQVLDGVVPGRRDAKDITLYKSLGIAAQDLAAAQVIWDCAQREPVGTRVAF